MKKIIYLVIGLLILGGGYYIIQNRTDQSIENTSLDQVPPENVPTNLPSTETIPKNLVIRNNPGEKWAYGIGQRYVLEYENELNGTRVKLEAVLSEPLDAQLVFDDFDGILVGIELEGDPPKNDIDVSISGIDSGIGYVLVEGNSESYSQTISPVPVEINDDVFRYVIKAGNKSGFALYSDNFLPYLESLLN